MQIAVISDLHLGAKNSLDRFSRVAKGTEASFLRLLVRLERNVDHIVLLGDIFETLRGPAPGTSEKQLRMAMEAYPSITRRALHHPQYQLVQGNHDFVTSSALSVPGFHEIQADKTKLLFFHGHQLDWVARGQAPLSRMVVWLGGLIERMGLKVTALEDKHVRGHKNGEPNQKEAGRFEHAACAMGRARGADIVINGHTHRAARFEVGDQLYMNSGACVAGRQEVLLLDTVAQRYEIIRGPDIE